jgi:exodeoxyribonuclease V alpha subunit
VSVLDPALADGGSAPSAALDPFDFRWAQRAPGLLRAFNDAGVLIAADVHVALRLGRLCVDDDDAVLLAAALAVRAPRLGHVYADLATVAGTVTVDVDRPVDLTALPWPEPDAWLERLGESPLVAVGDGGPDGRPLRLAGSWLYLDRYWGEERQVAEDLAARAAEPAAGVDEALLSAGLGRLFAGGATDDDQRLAAACAVLRRLAVVAGGPGTGKTTTVARILALLDEQASAAGQRPPLVALAAPTGKAAARLEEAVHAQAATLDVDEVTCARVLAASASTLHRLLGSRPDSRSRFRHHRGNRLPYDVVVVDETSMVSLSLMARLLEAVRTEARLVLVGDPQQLASVEAGAVLGDVVGPAADGLRMRTPARASLGAATGVDVPAQDPPPGSVVGDGVVVLRQVHRFGGAIAQLAEAIRQGDTDRTVAILAAGDDDLTWLPVDVADTATMNELIPVRAAAVAAGQALVAAARAGDARAALDALGTFRLLCAHRRGPYGVTSWMAHVERWLSATVSGFAADGAWYVGRSLLVTKNDYGLRLFNGDTGVVIAAGPDRVTAVFERRNELLRFSPTRLAAVETVHAMTIHKSQGSQFATVAVLLPDPTSPILTRELLYTGVTRAQQRLILAGTEEAVRVAVGRPIARASGLRRRLWGIAPARSLKPRNNA